MRLTINFLLIYILVYGLAFEDLIYVYGEPSQELLEKGRIQYQIIKERTSLPKYGSCWKAAIEHINEGCKNLSEETQSDMALHITNCFLEMSGHETYNCQLDKKQNLRAICINSMSDRAFNVYTEFYTHTQNICWFLRGQIWHETIAENTVKVGKQLELTAENQADLLRSQQESISLQESILNHGKGLEAVMENLYISAKSHEALLTVLSDGVTSLKHIVIGELSLINSLLYYVGFSIFILIVTSAKSCAKARLIAFLILFLNFIIERIFISVFTEYIEQNSLEKMNDYLWFMRYAFVSIIVGIFFYHLLFYKDLNIENNLLLKNILKQNEEIIALLKFNEKDVSVNVLNESGKKILEHKLNNIRDDIKFGSYGNNLALSLDKNKSFSEHFSESNKENINLGNNVKANNFMPWKELKKNRYNLRSRQGTPEC